MKFQSRFHGYKEIRKVEGLGVCLQNEILELRIPEGSMTWPGVHMAEWNNDKSS